MGVLIEALPFPQSSTDAEACDTGAEPERDLELAWVMAAEAAPRPIYYRCASPVPRSGNIQGRQQPVLTKT